MRIGIFGGTFNPPHNGHIILLKDFEEQMKLDKVLIEPTYVPPHKETSELASCDDRVKMCELMFKSENHIIDLTEIDRKGKSYTHDTLSVFTKRYKNAELFLTMGSDMLLSFHTWLEPKEILRLSTVCVATRQYSKTNALLQDYCINHFPDEYYKGRIVLLDCQPLEISSTKLREMIRNKKTTEKYIPKNLREYIDERGLYR